MAVNSNRLAIRSLLFLFFIYIQFFHGLDQLGLVGPDEPRYAQVAREMMLSGDFITPRLYGQPWFEKPVLYYWLAATCYSFLGVTEVAARLPSALCAGILVFVVFIIGWKWQSRTCGLVASLMLASSPMCVSLGRAASMDMLLTTTLTLSLGGFYLGFITPWEKRNSPPYPYPEPLRHLLYFSYFFLALALLTKGPVSLVLFGLILSFFFVLHPERFFCRKLRLVQGAILLLAVASPWYLLCYRANGWVFVDEFLLKHNLARFATDRFQHSQPLWFFIAVLAVGFLPWTIHFGAACAHFMKNAGNLLRDRSDPGQLFFWAWAIVPLIFFSLSRSKLPGYLLPIFPAISLLAASHWERCTNISLKPSSINKFDPVEILQSILLLGAGIGIIVWGQKVNLGIGSLFMPLGLLVGGTGCVGLILTLMRLHKPIVGNYLVGSVLIVFFITHQIFPRIDGIESSRQLASVLKRENFQGEPVYVFGVPRRVAYGLSFYLNSEARIIYSFSEISVPTPKSFYLLTPLSFSSEELLGRFRVEKRLPFHPQCVWKLRLNDAVTSP